MALVPVEEARRRLLGGLRLMPAEELPLGEAFARTLARDLAATRTQPPFAASAMDGYALRAEDIAAPPARLKLIGEAAAGHGFAGTVGAGETVRIFTGAPMPAGSDTVLIQENADREGDVVTALEGAPAGRFVRAAGLDFSAGETLLSVGRRLDERALSLAAAMGHARLPVRRRPRVAILATGDELVRPGETPRPDQIVASNFHGIAALVTAAGGAPVDLGIAPDDLTEIRRRIASAGDCDVVTLLGGASVGDHDFTRRALEEEGFGLDFWKIAMRPGKPLMSGRCGERIALGLPGNPVASLVCGRLFLMPLIAALLGRADTAPPEETATLGCDLGANDQREDYLRARLERIDSAWIAHPFPVQDSSMLAVMAAADGLVVRPPFAPPAAAGEACRIIRF
ncbi:gephyrin-like molybdotransferase Glp [Methylobrevis pamukkalensis]|uniref:Molybdopterin molybdenumtransferase n=1 Tax=Methylobrevis pamukkalensis TaxID=1439726 RepID=A0A1E3GYZ5_9HYPH|nr:gephyrin-like molybdotransferase Glp [Methylobrevis pamukkalensis]ODN68776.1 Molybdopterin molybdenumtransferase [Methylobrevis pamukkalensis]